MKVYIVGNDAFIEPTPGYFLRIASAQEAMRLSLAELQAKAMIAIAEKEAQR